MGKIVDARDSFLHKWNKIMAICCVFSLSFDPLFFYIPVIDRIHNCLRLDKKLQVIACVLRSNLDIFYLLHIALQFKTAYSTPRYRSIEMGELVVDPLVIAKKYLSFYFIIDILSVLPLPQMVMLLVAPNLSNPIALVTKASLKYVILIQYIPRLIRVYPLYKEVKKSSNIFTETAWARAASNLLLYMLAGHAVGSVWYLFSIERQDRCWRNVCETLECDYKGLYCNRKITKANTFLNDLCPLVELDGLSNSAKFNFGIFLEALQSGVVETRDFPEKLFYCFWWGLRNLSSLGQNLKTSTFVWENFFAIFIAIFGLCLFSLLIGNMQKYLQSMIVRIEEMTVKRRDAEGWMSHRRLPESLRGRIRRFEQYKWQQTRGVEEDCLIRSFPKDLRRDIKRHLCMDLITRVPIFNGMDEHVLDAICDHLKPVLYTEHSYIVREGDLVDEMIFIKRGKLSSVTTDGGRIGFFNSAILKGGDFCGEELLGWALNSNSSHLPSSTRTIQAKTEVEAFTLIANDLKLVASQFRRLRSMQFQHNFRFYSQQWRTWAACFIQKAWHQYRRRKLEKSLFQAEDRQQGVLANVTETSSYPGTTVYASLFTANQLRTLWRIANSSSRSLSDELDFSSKDR